MSKLKPSDFKQQPFASASEYPEFEHVKSTYIPRGDEKAELPKDVAALFEKEDKRGRDPMAWILKVKRQDDKKAYAIVTDAKDGDSIIRVVDKNAKTIAKFKATPSLDALDE
jgi:hypothetical protein